MKTSSATTIPGGNAAVARAHRVDCNDNRNRSIHEETFAMRSHARSRRKCGCRTMNSTIPAINTAFSMYGACGVSA